MSGESYEQILATVDRSEYELVVVPAPFGRDLDKIGIDSTGTIIDILFARSRVPLLVIRRPYSLEEEPFEHVVMLMTDDNGAAPTAASWTVGMVSPQGNIELVLVWILEGAILEQRARRAASARSRCGDNNRGLGGCDGKVFLASAPSAAEDFAAARCGLSTRRPAGIWPAPRRIAKLHATPCVGVRTRQIGPSFARLGPRPDPSFATLGVRDHRGLKH